MTDVEMIADMVERYGLRVEAGPAVREHRTPINRHREDPDVATAVRKHTRALAGMIRAGIGPEEDWPLLADKES